MPKLASVFKFEEIIADKPKEISRLLKFLEIENADLAKIVEDVSLFHFNNSYLIHVFRVISKKQESIDKKKLRKQVFLLSRASFSEMAILRGGKKN